MQKGTENQQNKAISRRWAQEIATAPCPQGARRGPRNDIARYGKNMQKNEKTRQKGAKEARKGRIQDTGERIQTSQAGTMEEQTESLGVHSCS